MEETFEEKLRAAIREELERSYVRLDSTFILEKTSEIMDRISRRLVDMIKEEM